MNLSANIQGKDSSPIRIVNALYDEDSDEELADFEPPTKRVSSPSLPDPHPHHSSRWETNPLRFFIQPSDDSEADDDQDYDSIETELVPSGTQASKRERLVATNQDNLAPCEMPSSSVSSSIEGRIEDTKNTSCIDFDHNPSCEAEKERASAKEDILDSTLSRQYALKTSDLPQELVELLRDMKDYFTKAVNLERQTPPLSVTTFKKAEERICCE